MKKILNKHMIWLFALVASLLLMTTMYAAINSITGDIRGKVIADKQTGIYITDVQYVSDIDADLGTSTITNFKGTFMQNTVKLSSTNSASEIKYKVTVYNNSDKSYPFLAVLYDEEFYDNLNIIFEISSEGYKIGDIINPHETRDIFIIFKYKDGQIPQNTTLNANLNFKIADPNRMMLASYSEAYLRGTINKDKIETIKFELGKIEPPGTISSFDASEKQDGSIMGYYTDANNDELYDLTFASNELIYANVNASNLFADLKKLKNIEFFNFSTFGTMSMSGMFGDCESLNSLDVSKFDTSEVVDMYGMFIRCKNITSLDLSNFHTSQVQVMGSMFSGCSKLKSLNVTNFDTSKVTDMDSMFAHCTSLKDLDISGFDTSQVTDMGYMFGECREVTNIDVSNFNTSNVTDMHGMFCGCDSVSVLDVSNFNTSNVIDMMSMFMGCQNLTFLNVSNFDTRKVTNMYGIFSGCKILTTLDLSKFNTNQVTNMELMFCNCSSLTTIYASEFNPTTNTGWTTSSVTNSTDMFINATKLIGGYGTKYDANHIDEEYARLDRAGTPGYLTNIKDKDGKSPSQLFDQAGTNPDGLHIGDFVNYDAGTWTQEEIDAIKTGEKSSLVTANGSTNRPTQSYQFGGFTAGSSRNGNATPFTDWGNFNYIKDKEINTEITGWRLFDIDENMVILISAGNPESYYHPYENGKAYQSEYILTGNINSSWTNGTIESSNYQKRNWDKYVNINQKAQSAIPLTKEKLDSWYNKYLKTTNANTYDIETFQKIYQKEFYKFQNIIDNFSFSWLATAYHANHLYAEHPYDRRILNYDNYAFGIRILVTLSSDVKFSTNKIGMKTVTGGNMTQYGGDQTYNVWGIVDDSGIIDKEKPIAGTMTMKLDNANGEIYTNNTTTEQNVYVEVNNGYDTVGGSGHRITTYTIVKDGIIYLANQTGANILTEPGIYTITVTTIDNAGNIAIREGYIIQKIETGKSPSQLFDQAGTNPDGLHIGDFVNYDAGTWTQEEIDEIKTGEKSNLVTANGSTILPNQGFRFGGFVAGASRNGNASPNTEYGYSNIYVKDKATGQAITGWRVFDVKGDRVTLISAGNPEDYYHPYASNQTYGYVSEYILTGNVNSKWNNGVTESEKYQKRDWSKYINTAQKAQNATPITKSRLDSWYTKYINIANANTHDDITFRKIYEKPYIKYQNMIENYSRYWIVTATEPLGMSYVLLDARNIRGRYNAAFGVRLLVTLSPDLKLTPQKLGTKTVTGGNMTQYGGDQTYNVWGIK